MAENDDIGRQIEAAAELAAETAPDPVTRQVELFAPGEATPADEPRGAGRPAGSRNKRTADVQRWFKATGKMPLEFLAEIYRADTEKLAAKFGVSGKAALQAQIAAASAVLPYVEQKLPLAIEDVTDRPRQVIVVGIPSEAQSAAIEKRMGLRLRAPTADAAPQTDAKNA